MQITGKDGKKYDLSLACEDIIAHEKLTDEVSASWISLLFVHQCKEGLSFKQTVHQTISCMVHN